MLCIKHQVSKYAHSTDKTLRRQSVQTSETIPTRWPAGRHSWLVNQRSPWAKAQDR